MGIDFSDFFHLATGKDFSPYPYQHRLGIESWPDIIKVPTGLGKTAGIIISWLFKRFEGNTETPRRLVYCLPMRVLVEQTAANAQTWVNNLSQAGIYTESDAPAVSVLMGGDIDRDWDRFPEQETILIGTQDQLLSRALNRGYGTSRFRWPVQFGLLNNDCLWVMDEIQLMGSGLAATAQLQAFREMLGTVSTVRSIWMSATLQKEWLKTIDFAEQTAALDQLGLKAEDTHHDLVKKRLTASKLLRQTNCPADKPKEIAKLLLSEHRKGARTLAVFNTVKRAVSVHAALKRLKPEAQLTLVHSRFRPQDRHRALQQVLAPPGKSGTICIATQVVEAGVDVSAATLLTDLAPWASLVQRFGRCNRTGSDRNAKIIWLSPDLNRKGAALPYQEADLEQAREVLSGLSDASPGNLPDVFSRDEHVHVLRRKDIIDLFDTTPDLCGMDIDISRFIRDADDHDVYVFWRDVAKDETPSETGQTPSREELCSVPVNQLRSVKELDKWVWDHLEKRWTRPAAIAPGMRFMLRRTDGCYSSETGWTGNKRDVPDLIEIESPPEETNDDDRYSFSVWQTLAEHTDAVVRELQGILDACPMAEDGLRGTLLLAARWHDAGKAHEVFQRAMTAADTQKEKDGVVWAKSGGSMTSYQRKGFRHELASALAMLENGLPDLAAFLAACHHGKVRLSIRSLPNEKAPGNSGTRFARGIWDGDTLESTDLGGGLKMPLTALDLSYMEFGDGPKGPSWLSRMLSLRDDESLGPFRLAYLEALIRAADWRASAKAGENDA